MRVLFAHNCYRISAGEDELVRREIELLKRNGDQVELLRADNSSLNGIGTTIAGITTVWNPAAYLRMLRLIRSFRPDIISVHNVMPQLSPSLYYAARAQGVPAVQTLHNFRLMCPPGTMVRNGGVCQSCLGRTFALPGIWHACYRGSRLATLAVAAMTGAHTLLGTWRNTISAFIALTEFARQRFIKHGLPAERIVVKPNFVLDDPGLSSGGKAALFVGRLSDEKGLGALLEAWKLLSASLPLWIAGDGPMREEVRRHCQKNPNIRWLGWRPRAEVPFLMRRATLLIVPSVGYEGFPLAVVEAFATGLPVIASNIGSLSELVDHGRTGLLFRPGDAQDLAGKIDWAFSHPTELARMRKEARAEYEAKYTAERNYQKLREIYQRAIEIK